MSTRRQFLGTLAKSLGTGGLLLPLSGGAVSLVEPAKAAALAVRPTALPLSADALLLRSLKRDLRRCQDDLRDPHTAYSNADCGRDWRDLMCGQVKPLQARMLARAPASWADCVELAEIAWWGIAHQRSLAAFVKEGGRPRIDSDETDPKVALVEAVLSLGGGERFSNHAEEDAR